MIVLLMMLLSSLAAILIVDEFEPIQYLKNKSGLGRKRRLKSDRKIIDIIIYTIHKILNCSACCSYHIFWISYLIYYHSLFGMILGIICYFLTFIFKEKIFTIRL
jgi:hypothetical protein